MAFQNSASLFLSLLLIECGFCIYLPINHNRQLEYGVSLYPIQPHFIIPIQSHQDNREELSDYFSADYWLPIEINVPDTVISAWDTAGAAWIAASDYFSMGEEASRYSTRFNQSEHNNSND